MKKSDFSAFALLLSLIHTLLVKKGMLPAMCSWKREIFAEALVVGALSSCRLGSGSSTEIVSSSISAFSWSLCCWNKRQQTSYSAKFNTISASSIPDDINSFTGALNKSSRENLRWKTAFCKGIFVPVSVVIGIALAWNLAGKQIACRSWLQWMFSMKMRRK